MVTNITFYDLNQMDNLNVTIEDRAKTVIFQEEKRLDNNRTAFVTIYDDGFASFGLRMQSDPAHGNQPYTWSSNSDFINQCFELNGTPFQLARYGCGVNSHIFECYYASELTCDLALKFAESNQASLKYGLVAFCEKMGRPIRFCKPEVGITLTNKRHAIHKDKYRYDQYIETADGSWMLMAELNDWMRNREDYWFILDFTNVTLR